MGTLALKGHTSATLLGLLSPETSKPREERPALVAGLLFFLFVFFGGVHSFFLD